MWYVVICGEDGEPYLTDSPSASDEVVYRSDDLFLAEIALSDQCSRHDWDDSDSA